MSASSLIAQGYGGYAGWGDAEADADFNATGGAGKLTSGGSGMTDPMALAQQYAQSIVDAQKKQIEDETKFLDQYTKDNPFVFDENLARQSAKAEYEPYYTELLQDYLKEVDNKRQTYQSEQSLLKDMYTLDKSKRSMDYEKAIANAQQGYAGQGMFFSGIRARAEGQEQKDYLIDTERNATAFNNNMGNINRDISMLDLNAQQKGRDIGREQQASIESGILQRKREATTQYNTPLIQSYYRRFPSSGGSVLSGYTVPDYLQYNV